MTIQLINVKSSTKNHQKTVPHESIHGSDVDGKIPTTKKESQKMIRDTKNRSKQYFRDINVHHQHILNLIK